jgi:methionine synthase I (cobalamin-dependent)
MEHEPQTHDLQGYSYQDRQGLLPNLTRAFTDSGGWVLERKTTSATTMEFRIEIQLHGIVELYSSLVATGLELTRGTHDTLTALCTSRKHIAGSMQPGRRLLTIRLELNFLEDVTLHSLLMTGSGLA